MSMPDRFDSRIVEPERSTSWKRDPSSRWLSNSTIVAPPSLVAPPCRTPTVRRILPRAPVDRLTQQVRVADVPGVLLDLVHDQPSQVDPPLPHGNRLVE